LEGRAIVATIDSLRNHDPDRRWILQRNARTLEGISGLWRDRKDIGSTQAYIRRLRRGTRRRRILGY